MSKKLLVFAVMATLAFGATISMATASRLENLGEQGLYLADDTNIFTNPATVSFYSKVLALHMGGYNGGSGARTDMWAFGGGTLPIMEGLTLGVFFARNPAFEEGGISAIKADAVYSGTLAYFLSRTHWTGAYQPAYYTATWQNPFDVILGYKMGDLSVGLGGYLANGKIRRKFEQSPGTGDWDETGRAWLGSLKVGASYKMGNIQPEVWLNWDPYKIKTDVSYDLNDQEDSTLLKGNKIVLGGRAFVNLSDNLTVVPALTWEHVTGDLSMDYSPNYGGVDEGEFSTEYLMNSISAGASVQYKADKLFVVCSASLLWSNFKISESNGDYADEDWDNTTKSFAAPVVAMGLEYQAMKLVSFRGGLKTTTIWANSAIVSDYNNDATDYDSTSDMGSTYQSTTASLGAAFHFGNLILDVTFGNLFLTGENGGNPAVGTAGPNLFSSLDATYVF